ncbi:hypothetical protein CALCODRAFT_499060 [Calocera cornea HHB12733]|uniref:N-acetyltransferase domain-containing protein n=1 Tax=Calocera cornea HHB12733 TaxID=1353952 RepID=A0A165ELM7_9BASI|nr:hypothetical protein CALCODRAFT_499060 [Calocera cornea HHB12733]
MTQGDVQLHIRRLIEPSELEMRGVLRVLTQAFMPDPVVEAIFAGPPTPAGLDAMNSGFVRAALVEGQGELWVAELERSQAKGIRDIVGVGVWYVPGNHALSDERESAEVWWAELLRIVGKKQADWFLDYFLPRMAGMWERYLPTPGDTLDDGYHCQMVCVLPQFHNNGIVSSLLAPVISRAVREGQRVLGEASSAENASKYAHMGCRIFGSESFEPLPETGLRAFKMWPLQVAPEAFLDNKYWNREKGAVSSRLAAKL